MQNSGQNQGGHQGHNDRSGGGQDKARHDHKNAQDKAKIWQKIEGAVAKDKINEFKQEFAKGQEGQPDAAFHKKKRRRRRKKKSGEINPSQYLPQKIQSPEVKPNIPEKKPEVKKVMESPFNPSFEDDEEKEEKEDEAIFADEETDESAAFVEPAQDIVETEQAVPSEKPVVEEPEEPEEPEVPEEPEEPEVPETPSVPELPVESEDVPPTPPVAPINPFDFAPNFAPNLPPNTSVVKPAKPVNPFENNKNFVRKENEKVKPINPFDLTEPASVEDKKEVDMRHKVTPMNQGVYKEASSPEDIGESNEFMPVNDDDSAETTSAEDEEDIDKIAEVIEVKASEVKERKIEPVFPDKIDQVIDDDIRAKDDFWTILEHAGINKQKLVIFAVVLLLILGVGLFFIFGGFSSSPQLIDRPIVTKETPQSVTIDQRPYDVIASYIFGLEYQSKNGQIEAQPISAIGSMAGVDAGLIFGMVTNLKQERFVEYVKLLERMNNIYNVDIYAMLDLSVDRRATLDKYSKDVNNLIDQGSTALAIIQGDLQSFNAQYDASSKQANSYETAFFSQVRNFYGQTSYDNLQLFMDTSAQAMRVKAQYGAENILKNMFINSLAALKPRTQDISTNTEALIKGVRVFDVRGSDINAILPVK